MIKYIKTQCPHIILFINNKFTCHNLYLLPEKSDPPEIQKPRPHDSSVPHTDKGLTAALSLPCFHRRWSFTLNHRFYHNCITAASAKKTRRGSGQLRQNWICAGQQGKHEAFRRAAAALWLQMPNTQSRQPLKRGWLPAANNEAESRP